MADFFTEFRNDHRFVLRALVDLREAIDAHDVARAFQVLEALDAATGPHMEFEERYLYPLLAPLVGDRRVKELIDAHTGAANMLYKAKQTVGKEILTAEDMEFLRGFIEGFLQHASDCEGTALLAETLSQEQIEQLGEQLVALRSTGKPLTVYKGVVTE